MEQSGGGGEAEPLDEKSGGDLGIAEAASPISSRPPANFEDMIRVTAEGSGGGGGSSTGNRWPRQETLALLQIRSEMDNIFRDATPKGPLWEQVSRKLAELGYKRSGKKCKEKFENVHKYYKRTKEGRTGRQDGKSYKFFNQLEALHATTPTSATTIAATISATATVANPVHIVPPIIPNPAPVSASLPPPMPQHQPQPPPPQAPPPDHTAYGISFSSSEDDDDEDEEDDDEEEDKMETESASTRKRKRSGQSSSSDSGMMEFFEVLMRQVMQKQEALQQRLLEAIEKREQDRMIREEAWKRQNMARVAREHELIAQERVISATRDAAIVNFLQKITGETINLPTSSIPQNQPPPPPASTPPPPAHQQPIFQQHQQPQTQNFPPPQQQQPEIPSSLTKQSQIIEPTIPLQPTNTSVVFPSQDFTVGGSSEAASSRWPKAEVLELIHLRSGLESKYQDPGPKGPLWEEISAGMRRIGYNRSAKRCKEKWENINKYYKKVKESKKQRPEDAKTCPYFHELDALYKKKVLGSSSGGGGGGEPTSSVVGTQQSQDAVGGEVQPEDIVRKRQQQNLANPIDNFSNNINGGSSSYNLNQENHDDNNFEEVDENEEYDDETEEDMKMAYNIQFHRQNVGSSNGNNGPTSTSFLAMVQ